MPAIASDTLAGRLRERCIRVPERKVLVVRFTDSPQERDLKSPPNCQGFGRIRHFTRVHGDGRWPDNPLPIDPVARTLGIAPDQRLEAQVFQLAACNWRCWYCYVPDPMLSARETTGAWLTTDELLDFYIAEPDTARPRVIDLTGGQPDLAPEWIVWMMRSIRARGMEGSLCLWSDDNLSIDYFWKYLSDDDRAFLSSFRGYGRVACFKGFNERSFAFNTGAEGGLYGRQFELFRRYLPLRLDLYAYVTLTAPDANNLPDEMARFVDRLQCIDENLPLRTVPLRVRPFTVLDDRIALLPSPRACRYREAINSYQVAAVEAWQRELERRYSSAKRALPITSVTLGG